MDQESYLASFKYEGDLVTGGVLDALSASKALSGIDSSIKFFVHQEMPELKEVDFPIPVKVQEGSWEALIPTDPVGWMKAIGSVGGIALSTYFVTAAKKMAEHDFKDKGLREVMKGAIACLQWLIRLGKHLGHLALNTVSEIDWSKAEENLIGVRNQAKQVLYLPTELFRRLAQCPKSILSGLASVIEVERTLVISLFVNKETVSVEIDIQHRSIFFHEQDDEEVLFPELTHQKLVELDGLVTRANVRTNSLGFLYQDHILSCYPASGNIVRFKEQMFLPCRVKGIIDRMDKFGSISEKKPKIIIQELNAIGGGGGQLGWDFGKDGEVE